MRNKFTEEIDKLRNNGSVDQKIMQTFLDRLKKGSLTRDESPIEHFCSFFLPVDKKSKMIFIGHHIKADDWIPPGGHIDRGESPRDTVYREFKEELDYILTYEEIKVFDICIVPVRKTTRPCRTHYDFWYKVVIDKIDFTFDRKEFYDAAWLPMEEALKRVKRDVYREVLQKLANII